MAPEELSLPSVIGHRGAAAHAPENTLAGFRAAHALDCAWVEFDARLSGDGAPVLCHDDRLERTTGKRGRISKLPLEALRRLDAGSWFAEKFAGERIPTLDEALSCCHELGMGANVELKAEPGRGPATAIAVAACLCRLTGDPPPVLVSSFDQGAVAAAATRMPSYPRAILFRRLPRDWAAIAARLGCATVNADQHYLTEHQVADVRAAGYPLLAYTVNDPARARQLFDWGVASVFSDAPDIISAATTVDAATARSGARS